MRDFRPGKHRGKWCVVYTKEDGTRARASLGTDDRLEAERRFPTMVAALSAPPVVTVESIWNAYCAENEGRPIIKTMRSEWRALGPIFGHMKPDQVTAAMCRAYADMRRAKGIRDGTIWTELGHLRMTLLWGVKRRLIEHAPHVPRPMKPPARDRYLTRDEAVALIDAADQPHARLAIILLLGTAARIGAVLDLTWDRVDFSRGIIHLALDDGKRRKGRASVPMNGMLRGALAEAREAALTGHVIEYGGEPVRSIKRAFTRTVKRAGLSRVTPHVLRHTAAVWMAEAGVPMPRIAQYLGHEDSRLTERCYARFAPEHLKEEAAVLNLELVRIVK